MQYPIVNMLEILSSIGDALWYSGLAGTWNRGIIAHQALHFRRPPKHANNKGMSGFVQISTQVHISDENF